MALIPALNLIQKLFAAFSLEYNKTLIIIFEERISNSECYFFYNFILMSAEVSSSTHARAINKEILSARALCYTNFSGRYAKHNRKRADTQAGRNESVSANGEARKVKCCSTWFCSFRKRIRMLLKWARWLPPTQTNNFARNRRLELVPKKTSTRWGHVRRSRTALGSRQTLMEAAPH